MPKGRAVTSFNGKTYSTTGHNLDRIFERDGIAYGAEIKNTLSYIDVREYRAKLDMCRVLACIIHVVEGAKSLLCYKHVVKTVFEATKEASA